MKIRILALTLSFFSNLAFAGLYTSSVHDTNELITLSNTNTETNSFQNSNGNSYIVLDNAYATTADVNIANVAWLDTLGNYTLFIDNTANQGGGNRQIALNENTEHVAILTGKLAIKLHDFEDIESILNNYNLELSSRMDRISLFFAKSSDPLQDKNQLDQDPRVTRVDIELVEGLLAPK